MTNGTTKGAGGMTTGLIAPHGGHLIDLMVDSERAGRLREESRHWDSWDLTERQICDLELLMSGGFSPLSGFMKRADYESVCSDMRLQDGTLWPIPITLDLSAQVAERLQPGQTIALRDPEGVMLAALSIEEIWEPDRHAEALNVFGTDNPEHPGVRHLVSASNPVYIGGRVEGIQRPVH
jgi:sulfate adenylyltransferase